MRGSEGEPAHGQSRSSRPVQTSGTAHSGGSGLTCASVRKYTLRRIRDEHRCSLRARALFDR